MLPRKGPWGKTQQVKGASSARPRRMPWHPPVWHRRDAEPASVSGTMHTLGQVWDRLLSADVHHFGAAPKCHQTQKVNFLRDFMPRGLSGLTEPRRPQALNQLPSEGLTSWKAWAPWGDIVETPHKGC